MSETHSIAQIVQRAKGEYLEMPGLKLTPAQARRLWNLDELACQAILEALVDLQFLHRVAGGSYVRRDAA